MTRTIFADSEVEATDDLILSWDFFIDRTVDSLTLNERDMDAIDTPRRKRSSISIFTLSGNTDFFRFETRFSLFLVDIIN